MSDDTLQRLGETLAARRGGDPATSYTAALVQGGTERILKKVGEEATEVVVAAKDVGAGGDRDALVGEVADLWFHSLVLLAHNDIDPQLVLDELDRRFGLSGHEEKASRSKK